MQTKNSRFMFSPAFVLTGAGLLGMFSTISQVLIFREELVLMEGNELVLSSLLCWWLLGLMLGTLIPKLNPFERIPAWLCTGIFLAAPFLLFLSISILRGSFFIFGVPSGDLAPPIYVIILPLFTVFPLGLFYGITFTTMAQAWEESSINTKHRDTQTTIVSSIFMYEALGSVVGGLLLVLFLLPQHNAYKTILIMFCVSLTLLSLGFSRKPVLMILFGGLLLLSIFATRSSYVVFVNNLSIQARWERLHYGEFCTNVETPYQSLELGIRDNQYTLFGNGVPLFSFPSEQASASQEYEITNWAHVALSQIPDADSILLIGSGGNEMVQAMASHSPHELVCVEIDPGIQQITKDYQGGNWTTDKPLIIYKTDDPRGYFPELPKTQDFRVIALNQPDPINGLTNRVYTQEFFALARSHLADNGVLVFSTTGTPNYEQGDLGFFGATLYWTLRQVFDNVLVSPGTTWWYFASPSPILTGDPQELTRRFQAATVQTTQFKPEFYTLYFEPNRIEQLETLLKQSRTTTINTDNSPICYFYTLVLWLKQYGYLHSLPLQEIAEHKFWKEILGIIILLFMWFIPLTTVWLLTRRANRHLFLPTAVLSLNGMAGISVELCVLLFYQTQTGCLYEHISIFFGVFMAGLALGAQQALQYLAKKSIKTSRALWNFDTGFTVLLLITPVILYFCRPVYLSVPMIEIFLLCWIGILAFGMGAVFPLASGCIAEQTQHIPTIAGYAGMSDNLGGAVGALITGILLIPILGIPYTIWALCTLKVLLGIWEYWQIR